MTGKRALLWVMALAMIASAGPAMAQIGKKMPAGWKQVGAVEGLLGDQWCEKQTRYCKAWAQQGDLDYVDPIVKNLDASFLENQRFMGFAARGPLEFYFFPITDPAHTHKKFAARLGQSTRAAGVALSGTQTCVVNLGSQRHAELYAPWEVESTCRHEMNHLFAFQIRGADRMNSWGWLYEALAERVEDTVRPASTRLNLDSMKEFMKGYTAKDASWRALVGERNRDDLEQYRDYEKLLSSIVFFMEGKYGQGAVAKLMNASRTKDLEDAFVTAFGKGTVALEQEWKAFYGIR
ncbi:MAG: hypothetical protein HY319_07255 [Armatimonadetes bacterium]|nr:hypothetical protein [Armatimonadota bacterium]